MEGNLSPFVKESDTLQPMRCLSVLLLFLAGCPAQPAVPTVTPHAVSGSDWCVAAQTHLLSDVNCPDYRGIRLGSPNKHGVSFADVCRDEYANGIDLKAKCLSEAPNCQAVQACAP